MCAHKCNNAREQGVEAHFLSKTTSQLLMVREELDLNDLILLTGSLQSPSLQKWLFLSSKHALQTQFYREYFF